MRNFWQSFKVFVLLIALVACGQSPTPDQPNPNQDDPRATTNGLTGVYYDNIDFTGTSKTQVDATINKAWAKAAPITGIAATTYSVRWTGQIMPAFSETYTFYLTSSDGARLMVNGQVLVNNWTDHTSTVNSGTVTLQANTKYDIRLENYRNATNSSVVKLEWQSASRTRQVVPTGSLFPTGSNLDAALAQVKAVSGFPAGVNFDPLQATGSKTTNGFFLIAREQGKTDFMVASIRNNVVELLYRNVVLNNELILTSVLDQKTFNLGAISFYVNPDGTTSQDQKDNLSKKLISIVSQGNITTPDSVTPQSSKSQTRVIGWICTLVIPRPLACADASCKIKSDAYADAVCSVVGAMTGVIINGLTAVIYPPASKIVPFIFGGPDLPTAIGTFQSSTSISSLWQDYLDCISGKVPMLINGITRYGCPALLEGPTPNLISITKHIGDYGTISSSFNSSIASQSPLVYSWTFNQDSGFSGFSVPGLSQGKLLPGEQAIMDVSYDCRSNGIMKGRFILNQNAKGVVNPVNVPVTVECVAIPQISASPNPMLLTAPGNSSVTSSLTIKNEGTGSLEVTSIASSDTSWLTVTPSSLTGILSHLSQNISVTAKCRNLNETRTGTITITSNATNSFPPIPVTLVCTGNPLIAVTPEPLTLTGFVNTSVTKPLTISNVGTVNLNVSGINSNAPTWLSVSPTSFAGITPVPSSGSSQPANVTGTCGNIVETKTGVLTITSDSLLNSSRDVQVILNCQSAATISATPNPMNLQAEKSSSNADTLTIKNTGTSNLEVTGITSSDITWLTIPTTVIILAPGSSQTVNVTAACRGLIETRTGTLTIANNDPVNPRQVVNVSLQCYQGVVVTVKFAELYWTTPFGGVAAEPCNIAVAGWVIAVDVVSRVSDTGVGQLIVPNDGWAKGVDQVACAGVDAPMALAIKNARLYTSALLNMWKQHIKSSVTVVSEPRSFVYTHPNSIEGYLGTGGLPTPNTIDDGLVFLVDVLVPSP